METAYTTFSYVTAANAPLYRAIMLEFMRAKDRFIVHLRPEEVAGAVRFSEAECLSALKQLTEWGNLSADPDMGRVLTVEDFRRARFLYQLTAGGESTERALREFDSLLGRDGVLQSAALEDIRDQLRALAELARDDVLDAGKIHQLLNSLVDRFQGLADNAQAFIGSLQRTIDLSGVENEVFLAYKDRLIQYLERFVRDLIATGSDIARLIGRIEESGIDVLLRAAAYREAVDAAPLVATDTTSAETGQSLAPNSDSDAVTEAHLEVWRDRWRGVREWFIGSSTHESQSRLLRGRARTAITQLLQVVTAINERRSGRSDRAADFRQLAFWFAEARDGSERHRLARVAFGLSPSRHLTVDAATLDARNASAVLPNTPWAAAPPLLISPRLRSTGSYERTGRPTQVRDRTAARLMLKDAVVRQNQDLEAIRHQLVTTGPVSLTEFERVDRDAFEYLLRLLGDALGHRREDETVSVRSLDGSLEIRLSPAVHRDTALVALRTARGTLFAPDHRLEIVLTEGRS